MRRSALDAAAIWAGLIGASVLTLGSVVTGFAYRGTEDERYSPFNHWVSELGELDVSKLAPVFNGSLVIGGLLFAVFMFGLALTRTSRLRVFYGMLGVVAGIAGTGVGIFPMNDLDRHAIVALTFFNLGWIAVGLASLDFALHPDARFPRWLSVLGGVTVVAFVSFLVSLFTEGLIGDRGLAAPDVRASFWIVPTLEWALIVGIVTWVFLTAWSWRRGTR